MSRRIDVVYAHTNGEVEYVGFGENPNRLNEVIITRFPDISNALNNGIFYFRFSDDENHNKIPYIGYPYEFGNYITMLFNTT